MSAIRLHKSSLVSFTHIPEELAGRAYTDILGSAVRRFRIACQNTVFHCFETRVQQNDEKNKTLGTESASLQVEGRLWDMHVKINTRFRKLLSRVGLIPIE